MSNSHSLPQEFKPCACHRNLRHVTRERAQTDAHQRCNTETQFDKCSLTNVNVLIQCTFDLSLPDHDVLRYNSFDSCGATLMHFFEHTLRLLSTYPKASPNELVIPRQGFSRPALKAHPLPSTTFSFLCKVYVKVGAPKTNTICCICSVHVCSVHVCRVRVVFMEVCIFRRFWMSRREQI